jgi:hypothetical protein
MVVLHRAYFLKFLNLILCVCVAGELYVIVEYCHFGNLRTYLLKHKDSFCDTMDDKEPTLPAPAPPLSPSTDTDATMVYRYLFAFSSLELIWISGFVSQDVLCCTREQVKVFV